VFLPPLPSEGEGLPCVVEEITAQGKGEGDSWKKGTGYFFDLKSCLSPFSFYFSNYNLLKPACLINFFKIPMPSSLCKGIDKVY
jgi:hypothetical protein